MVSQDDFVTAARAHCSQRQIAEADERDLQGLGMMGGMSVPAPAPAAAAVDLDGADDGADDEEDDVLAMQIRQLSVGVPGGGGVRPQDKPQG